MHYFRLICFVVFLFMISASNPHFEGVYVIDDFQSYEVDQFPNEWKGRKKKAKKEYTIQMEENNKYLQAESHNSDMFILKKCNVDATKFQYLNWKWRVHEIPENGNESVKKQCDTPATIAVIFRLSKWRPKSLKYTFSSTLPPMTTTKSPYAKWPARTDILVLRNKDSGLGNWISEKQNVLEDYKKIRDVKEFDKLKIEGILIMTDSDNTKSSARADYDDIFFSIE